MRPGWFKITPFAEEYLNGYVDAIINHTDETDHDMIKGQFRIAQIGEESANKKTPNKSKKKDSVNETVKRI